MFQKTEAAFQPTLNKTFFDLPLWRVDDLFLFLKMLTNEGHGFLNCGGDPSSGYITERGDFSKVSGCAINKTTQNQACRKSAAFLAVRAYFASQNLTIALAHFLLEYLCVCIKRFHFYGYILGGVGYTEA